MRPKTPTRPNPRTPQGRGVTDCLGHVALLTELFVQLGERRPALGPTVVGVYIANEENATLCGIGAHWGRAAGGCTGVGLGSRPEFGLVPKKLIEAPMMHPQCACNARARRCG